MAAATYVAPKVIFALFRCTLRVTTLWPSNYSTIWVCGLSLVLGCRVSEHVKIRVHREAVRICLKLQSGDVIVLLGDQGEGRMVERSTSGSGERENVALRIILSRYEVLDYQSAAAPTSNVRSRASSHCLSDYCLQVTPYCSRTTVRWLLTCRFYENKRNTKAFPNKQNHGCGRVQRVG